MTAENKKDIFKNALPMLGGYSNTPKSQPDGRARVKPDMSLLYKKKQKK